MVRQDEGGIGPHAVDHDLDVDELEHESGHEARTGTPVTVAPCLRHGGLPCQPEQIGAPDIARDLQEGGGQHGKRERKHVCHASFQGFAAKRRSVPHVTAAAARYTCRGDPVRSQLIQPPSSFSA